MIFDQKFLAKTSFYLLFCLFILYLVLDLSFVSEYKLVILGVFVGVFVIFLNKVDFKLNLSKRVEGVLLIFILGLAFVYRIYFLGFQSFWIDESFSVLSAMNISEFGYPSFESPYLRSLIHSYSLFIMGLLFGFSEFSMRFLSVIAGVFIVYLGYLIGRSYGSVFGLSFSFILGFSYLMIAWSRQARMYIFLLLFVMLAFYFYFKYLESGEIKFLILSLFSGTLSGSFHVIGLSSVFAVLASSVIFNPKSIVFVLKNKFSYFVFVLLGYFLFKSFSVISFSNNFWSYHDFFLVEHLFFLVLSIPGYFLFKKNADSLSRSFVFEIFLVLNLFAVLFFVDVVNFRYGFLIYFVIYFLACFSIVYFVKFFSSSYAKVVVLVLLVFISPLVLVPEKVYYLEDGTPMPDFKLAYEEIRSLDGEFVVSHGAIHRLYYGKNPDFWLSIDLSGRQRFRDVDVYTGALGVYEVSFFDDFSGYVVLDDMAFARISDDMRHFIENQTLLNVWGDTHWHRVYLYEVE